ncbi:hypothetical protein BDV98DRAFT_658909 [Pterulicium gracile]|uniref:Uncharacterized protein n=1 Tax=Pterulicium gracile TaxID=1884261 RepID=A0A5C3Q5X6_9AGAR|nr:hypothetical protein BDV98DRAFT_658909 [Pterula gracilis]
MFPCTRFRLPPGPFWLSTEIFCDALPVSAPVCNFLRTIPFRLWWRPAERVACQNTTVR